VLPKVQCNSKEHVNRNIRKDKNADRQTGMVFWPWATNFRSIAHERRISDIINLSQYNFYVSLLLSRRLSFSLEKANSDLTKQAQRRMLMDLELSQRLTCM